MPLITRNSIPSGGWQYVQNDAGGNPLKAFRSFESFNMFTKEILSLRKGNNLPRATIEEVQTDVDDSTCIRVPAACGGGQVYSDGRPVGKCAGCG